MANRKMENDPLFRQSEKPLRRSDAAPEAEYTRATFMIRKDQLEKLKNYCYTERITQKEAVEKALLLLFKGVKESDLINRPEKK